MPGKISRTRELDQKTHMCAAPLLIGWDTQDSNVIATDPTQSYNMNNSLGRRRLRDEVTTPMSCHHRARPGDLALGTHSVPKLGAQRVPDRGSSATWRSQVDTRNKPGNDKDKVIPRAIL